MFTCEPPHGGSPDGCDDPIAIHLVFLGHDLETNFASRASELPRAAMPGMTAAGPLQGRASSRPGWDSALLLAIARRVRDVPLSLTSVRRFAPRLKSWFLRAVRRRNKAEDLVQRQLLSVWRRLECFDPIGPAPATLIDHRARSRALTRCAVLRARCRRRSVARPGGAIRRQMPPSISGRESRTAPAWRR